MGTCLGDLVGDGVAVTLRVTEFDWDGDADNEELDDSDGDPDGVIDTVGLCVAVTLLDDDTDRESDWLADVEGVGVALRVGVSVLLTHGNLTCTGVGALSPTLLFPHCLCGLVPQHQTVRSERSAHE